MKWLMVTSLATMIGFGNNVHAESVSWHGYLSQGLTQSIDSDFITDANSVTAELTELGLVGRYQFNSDLALVGQVVYLDGGNRYDQGGRLDYLFLDWRLPEYNQWQAHLHVGRYKNRHWLYSATRDVPQTRATAVLPQSVYYDAFRDIALGSDGALIQVTRNTNHGNWEFNWSYGRSPIDTETTRLLIGPLAKGEVEQDFVHQLSGYWQTPSLNWRVGVSFLDSDFVYRASEDDILLDGSTSIQRVMFSAMYFGSSVELSSELVKEYQHDRGAYHPEYQFRRIGEGGYIQGRYLFNSEFSALASFDTYVFNKDDPDGELLEAGSGGLIPAYFGYMDTTTLGLRWDIAPNWRLQAEHHWVNGANRTKGILNPEAQVTTRENWRMWALQLMFWF
ncbi:hypothetical protein DXV75_16485 [Alteromonas aestuariivivens]|uniref:Porin n=1 Tax=Alteromonas aestuariivivens TaxID=1938339 RepID=A0A3D8M2U3_9ALTE|nr:hypothetical protein [Alteromonas aestuariivivens]RDV23961.1 hypothetical protein DXV75_16485 [Alteromonas aestuariivivens]